ncbi:MAG TPA: DUF2147 domain-containing protein [Methylovirgula sp.]
MKIHSALALLSMTSALAFSTSAFALPGPVGEWLIADGSAIVNIRPCGDNLCGFVASRKDSESSVGQQVFFDMKPEGGQWSGTIVNVKDGEHYAGHISLVSDTTLKVEGCVLGGIFCGGQQWSRVK